ncbi:MAG: hypothetical protein BWY66_00860 [bacterium ADurb.Bin374]|nr:MAG: hypothetical protein BWY66_00860 [bacterium ADurb.Bin374]
MTALKADMASWSVMASRVSFRFRYWSCMACVISWATSTRTRFGVNEALMPIFSIIRLMLRGSRCRVLSWNPYFPRSDWTIPSDC